MGIEVGRRHRDKCSGLLALFAPQVCGNPIKMESRCRFAAKKRIVISRTTEALRCPVSRSIAGLLTRREYAIGFELRAAGALEDDMLPMTKLPPSVPNWL